MRSWNWDFFTLVCMTFSVIRCSAGNCEAFRNLLIRCVILVQAIPGRVIDPNITKYSVKVIPVSFLKLFNDESCKAILHVILGGFFYHLLISFLCYTRLLVYAFMSFGTILFHTHKGFSKQAKQQQTNNKIIRTPN